MPPFLTIGLRLDLRGSAESRGRAAQCADGISSPIHRAADAMNRQDTTRAIEVTTNGLMIAIGGSAHNRRPG